MHRANPESNKRHIMVVSPRPYELEGFNRDGSNRMSFATADQLFLDLPIRRSDNP
jgi:hypothetical protein